MIILGCDPGLSGALVLISTDGVKTYILSCIDMPTLTMVKNKRDIDVVALGAWLKEQTDEWTIDRVVIEKVHSMPKQGVASTFKFGMCYGALRGAVATLLIPTTLVTPQAWKKKLSVASAKDGAIARATELMPHERLWWKLKKHDGRAEAAMIALWGFDQ